ncbi:preprotein translocase subunit SecA [Candidatus Similichlamydia epinepheli]|uniref:preprotein translocase subunit SecA n=1 Tax=Candidatus Similichlamydia epinepheli TaxID=1903953 RepID=UPI000D33B9C9|nr:preprotein translocase subunit SecA [Candidatus Similichlamydia epinepheli]
MFRLLRKLFGSAQERRLKTYWRIVEKINAAERRIIESGVVDLSAETESLKARHQNGESLEKLLPEAYALVKCACRQLCGTSINCTGQTIIWDMVPFDVQLVGGVALHFGTIAEMQTGEGKTLTAVLPSYLHVLSGEPVHIVTVNDYLAQRDCEWNSYLFNLLGVSCGFLKNEMSHGERKKTYDKEIVYGTASEFGFDYLRDNSIATSKEEQVQGGHSFAIIDEIDFVLIDDARTPLRISGPSRSSGHLYEELKEKVANLVNSQKEICNRIANKGWKLLREANATDAEMDSFSKKRSKKEEEKIDEGVLCLWVVSKGTPKNKILKKARELPFIRNRLDRQDLLAYGETAKETRAYLEDQLLILVDERSNDFELTDQGIKKWIAMQNKEGDLAGMDQFEMIDLGEGLSQIDDLEIDIHEKMQLRADLYREDASRKKRMQNLTQLLRAHLLMEQNVDYIIQNRKIVIIDENTGRAQPGRRYSEGLHQALEAKESLPIQVETITYATITLQNYFRMYKKLSGMSGTAETDAQEFKDIYGLEVLSIPTRVPCLRNEVDDQVYMTEREKYAAILEEIQTIHTKGRPILIGTRSVDESERMSRLLSHNGLGHTVLNAKHHAMEAEIISKAGSPGAITIATNMAGRGTDIRLGEGVAIKGGLHVIGSRHFSRRNDRQLIGRCARQGDPGSSVFFGSFEDDLMRLFASPKMLQVIGHFRPPEGESISAPMLTKAIDNAQKRIEQRNYAIRKHTLEYDDVTSKQRESIYNLRQRIISEDEDIFSLVKNAISRTCYVRMSELFDKKNEKTCSGETCAAWAKGFFPIDVNKETWKQEKLTEDVAAKYLEEELIQLLCEKRSLHDRLASEDGLSVNFNRILRWCAVKRLDQIWQQHLQAMDYLRAELPLRVGNYRDPLLEFKHEALSLFQETVQRFYSLVGLDSLRIDTMVNAEETPALQ